MIEEHDAFVNYCPPLGGEVPFRYCRIVNGDLPCRTIIACWEFRVETSKFLGEHYSMDQIQRALASPPRRGSIPFLRLSKKQRRLKKKESDRILISGRTLCRSSGPEGDREAFEERVIQENLLVVPGLIFAGSNGHAGTSLAASLETFTVI